VQRLKTWRLTSALHRELELQPSRPQLQDEAGPGDGGVVALADLVEDLEREFLIGGGVRVGVDGETRLEVQRDVKRPEAPPTRQDAPAPAADRPLRSFRCGT